MSRRKKRHRGAVMHIGRHRAVTEPYRGTWLEVSAGDGCPCPPARRTFMRCHGRDGRLDQLDRVGLRTWWTWLLNRRCCRRRRRRTVLSAANQPMREYQKSNPCSCSVHHRLLLLPWKREPMRKG